MLFTPAYFLAHSACLIPQIIVKWELQKDKSRLKTDFSIFRETVASSDHFGDKLK